MSEGKMPEICRWDSTGEGNIFETECGDTFQLFDGTPSENRMNFCPYCGKGLKEEVFNGAC